MTDDQPAAPATLLERMLAAGMSEDRARGHLGRGVVRVDGEHVTDPDTPLPWPDRYVIGPE